MIIWYECVLYVVYIIRDYLIALNNKHNKKKIVKIRWQLYTITNCVILGNAETISMAN